MRRRAGLALMLAALVSMLSPLPARATHAGGNGKIAFWVFNRSKIQTIEPDGTGRTTIVSGGKPRYHQDIWIAAADGSSAHAITDTPKLDEFGSDWQPTP